ncbi:MAG TPA: hypothetical protein VH583_10095 [Vicinamibacterales bacterium]|jgi:hypothetical protein
MRVQWLCVLLVVVGIGVPRPTAAQAERLTGCCIGGDLRTDAESGGRLERFTLEFRDAAGTPRAQIDFRTARAADTPAATRVVDVIVSELVAADQHLDLSIVIDGTLTAQAGRIVGRRSVASTMTLEELQRLSNARSVVERALGVELEFSAMQLQMLHTVAERWADAAAK